LGDNDKADSENKTIKAFASEFIRNKTLVDMVYKHFVKRLSRKGCIALIRIIIEGETEEDQVKLSSLQKKYASTYQYNMSKFEERDGVKYLKADEYTYLNDQIEILLSKLKKTKLSLYDESEHATLKKIEDYEGTSDAYVVDKFSTYDQVRRTICDNDGDAEFFYDFDKPDMELSVPENKETLQRCVIQILGNQVKFDYPIEYVYACPQCETLARKKAYRVVSTNTRYKCEAVVGDKGALCRVPLTPDNEISKTKDTHFFDINYEGITGDKVTSGAFTFKHFKPGFYEVVLFRIKNPMKTELFQIVDIKEIETNDIIIPAQKPEENYVVTLANAIDGFIKDQTRMDIHGLLPIKLSMILQRAFSALGMSKKANIQVVGDPSSGKSTVFKYYGYALHSHLNMSTNGLSISVPGLRGTRQAINLLGKELTIITRGYLGIYRAIHIDEAGEDKVLVVNLKTFLLDDNYSYDKAGSQGTFYTRTAHVNITQNIDQIHLGQYVGQIRKMYRDTNFVLTDIEKEEWNEKWDLFLPIYKYNNPYLRKIVKDVRAQYFKKKVWWIDGYDYAMHQRFPLYFFLVVEKDNPELSKVVQENVSRGTISENLELIRALNSDNLEQYFEGLKERLKQQPHDIDGFNKVDEILSSYGVYIDARTKEFFYNVLKCSKVINNRTVATEQDFDLIRYLVEKTNVKLDVADTNHFKVEGAPDLEKAKKDMEDIEDMMKEASDGFGLESGEFDD